MDLIYYRGLNCHLACIVTIAHSLGVRYSDAFAELWSETDFTDEADYQMYVSKRVFTGLAAVGIAIEAQDCGEGKTQASLSRLAQGESALVGIDTFDLPWHPVFRHCHDRHFIFIKKEGPSLRCFDPIYPANGYPIQPETVVRSAFELCRVDKLEVSPPEDRVSEEAKSILDSHPATEQKLLDALLRCEGEGRGGAAPLIKQISAMIGNRYLFRRFLQDSPFASHRDEALFDPSYFLRWEAIRNGLYKVTILRDNSGVIHEVYGLLESLMREEIAMAEAIIVSREARSR